MAPTIRRALIVGVLIAALGVTGCVSSTQSHPRQGDPATPALQYARTLPVRYAGVATFHLPAFIRACRCRPSVGIRYVHWGMAPDMTQPRFMLAHGILPLVELQPLSASLSSIVHGRQDRWLTSWARAIRDLGAPVLVSFAPEANGSRYSYGYHHVSARLYISAWRYVATLFARVGASRVRWVWIMISGGRGTEPLARLWPGDAWVSTVGLDGYLLRRGSTVEATFGPAIAAIRRFTRKPVLITETAASPAAGKARAVRELATMVSRDHLMGFVWFDIDFARSHVLSIWANDWRLETDPVALAAFRRVVEAYRYG